MDNFKPFRLSPITRAIAQLMETEEVGATITYEDLSIIAGMDSKPGGPGYGYVLSAIKQLEKSGHHFTNVENVGYRKLTADEAVLDVIHRQGLGRKREKRNVIKLESIDPEKLSPMRQFEHKAAVVFGRMATRVLSERARLKMIDAMERAPEPNKIDYESLTDIYLRKRDANSGSG